MKSHVLNAIAYLLILGGGPIIGGVLAFALCFWSLAWPWWVSILIALVGAAGGFLISWLWIISKMERDSELKDKIYENAYTAWQERYQDAVFGKPFLDWQFRGLDKATQLNMYQGYVSVRPTPPPPTGCFQVEVFLEKTGFTQLQRDFYSSLAADFDGLMSPFHELINRQFHLDFPDQGDFPRSNMLESLKIGREDEGQLEEVIIDLMYDQDAYVAVTLKKGTCSDVEFWM